jgi:hypothetical protein
MVPHWSDGDPEPRNELASRLCRSCGICCTGAMFAYVDVAPEEEARIRSRLPVLPAEGARGAHFLLGCPGHSPSGCSLYDDRPVVCARYRCDLLVALDRGDVSYESALGITREIKALYERLDRGMPPGKFLWDRAVKLRDAGVPAAVAERRRHGEMLLDLKVLERFLRKHLDGRTSTDGTETAACHTDGSGSTADGGLERA